MLLGALPASAHAGRRLPSGARFAAYPFTLGVASGEPTPTRVVLWTRLAPDALHGGGMPAERVTVRWEVAHDERFRRVARRGDAPAVPELAHSVHVEVEHLEPGRAYWYRFIAGGETSPVGRTRTAPAPGAAVDRLAFAFVSCQHYEAGHYTAYRHLAAEDVGLVVHLGDYIYEGGVQRDAPRQHNGPKILTLADYRNRYALYKGDAELQAAHRVCPWVVTWDDHEVENDYADETSQRNLPRDVFLRQRAAAYQAYYEHMPLRRTAMPRGPDMRLYRRLRFGALAEFNVLDTRQYRTDQACGDGFHTDCAGARDPSATLLGAEQERWLLDGLDRSTARWNVLANQVPFSPVVRRPQDASGAPGAPAFNMDKWDGYVEQRRRVVARMRDGRTANPVVLTGDVHQSWVADIPSAVDDPTSAPLGAEFVGTSISSGGNGREMNPAGAAILQGNPHVRFYNAQRGYVRCTVTPGRWTSDYRVVDFVDRPGGAVRTAGSFAVEAGRPGVHRA
jgi:alkaline phosphatase D